MKVLFYRCKILLLPSLIVGIVLLVACGAPESGGTTPIGETETGGVVIAPPSQAGNAGLTPRVLGNLSEGVTLDAGVSLFSATGSRGFAGQVNSLGGAGNIGLAVGGANDINNFRFNVANGYLPLPTDITHEGLFYDYFFDTGLSEPCEELFCPSYSTAVSPAPLMNETEDEYFLSVGLNSGVRQDDFERKKLNLIVVLDISGSMDEHFDRYYYDRFFGDNEDGDSEDTEERDWEQTKFEVAKTAITELLDHLNESDRFGLVLFDDIGHLESRLGRATETRLDDLRDDVSELTIGGGTNIAAGIQLATRQFEEYLDVDSEEYENRIVLLTDAQPNTGDTSEGGLLGMVRDNAENGVNTTFIGVGVDFNTELVEAMSKVRGANYYSVHSPADFVARLDEQFEYMVTPLVYDLRLSLEATGYEIREVYGSPEADRSTGELLYVNTLFASENSDEGTRGGLILLQLRRIADVDDASIELTASYEDVSGTEASNSATIEFDAASGTYDNTGIRKGVLLARTVNLLQSWILSEREVVADGEIAITRIVPFPETPEFCIPIVPRDLWEEPLLGRWERQSWELRVSDEYQAVFERFIEHIEAEMEAIGDDTLQQEIDMLQGIIDQA